ncbi:hypothetical protein AMQ68_20000 [Chryseobacterium sp. ERMR1:04]|nr:hypothetical protein AMQ68_20000 [Chryseobacterium sp. ERMR1:04]
MLTLLGYIININHGLDTSTLSERLFLNLMASLSINSRNNFQIIATTLFIYKDLRKHAEEIYKPFGVTKAIFYRDAKILDNHTDEDLKKCRIKY